VIFVAGKSPTVLEMSGRGGAGWPPSPRPGVLNWGFVRLWRWLPGPSASARLLCGQCECWGSEMLV